jgi:HAD superfamily hydrolase (TIGR01490 family)
VLGVAERLVAAVPVRGRAAEWGARLEERRGQLDRARSYVELYGAYTECEAVYGVAHLLALRDTLPTADREQLQLDPSVIDWDDYITGIHLPSVVEHGRARSSPQRGRGESRQARLRAQVLEPARHLAAFDLENTLIASNVVTSYSWLATRRLSGGDRVRFALRTLAEAPGWLAQDRADRSDFLRSFYRRYQGAPLDQLDEDAVEHFSQVLLARSFPAAIRRVREHRAAGHRTLLITGALDVVIEPLRPLFDDVVCARLDTELDDDGTRVLTGQLAEVPPTTEARARVLADYCAAEGLSLDQSVAYADSSSDLPMLEAVGFPVAVNPEPRLASIARKRGWLVEDFRTSPGARPPLLPIGPRWRNRTPVAGS